MTSTQQTILTFLLIATLAPLASSVVIIFVGKRWLGRASGWLATLVMAACFGLSLAAFYMWLTPRPVIPTPTGRWVAPHADDVAGAPPRDRPVGAPAGSSASSHATVSPSSGSTSTAVPSALAMPSAAAAPATAASGARRPALAPPWAGAATNGPYAPHVVPAAAPGTPATIVWNVPWLPIGKDPAGHMRWLYLGVLIDGLTIAMMSLVTGISFLVHLYSIGYMAGDKRFERFFAYLSLFSFSMLGIVMSNTLIELLVFWELVGLTSYLLIGFWFERRAPQLACRKAWVMNRIGDMGFMVGIGILFYQLGGNIMLPATAGGGNASMFEELARVLAAQGYSIAHPPWWLTLAGIGLFFGAIGKSAQFPLHTWLPDAMEGPTPVSSIVHSATMVAAGVYLTARIYPVLTPAAHLFVASIGLITLIMAACMALVMTDIKRVLAYSTLSQLGYMILGLGAGAYTFALFHLITHAFFKCCLFQCAGSVIHAAHHEQDMRQYGGLWRKLPVTAACYLLCTLAIAGASIPFSANLLGYDLGMSGYYSKDGIIAGAVNYAEALAGAGWWAAGLFKWGPLVVAFVTCFYMARSFALTFLGRPRDPRLYEHAEESPWTMRIPQVCLAIMALFAALFPFKDLVNETLASMTAAMNASGAAAAVLDGKPAAWAQPGSEDQMHHGFHLVHAVLLHGLAWIVVLTAGVLLYLPGMKHSARIAALPGISLLYRWAHNKFYFDALYDVFAVGLGKLIAFTAAAIDKHVVDGLVNLAGLVTRGWSWVVGEFDLRVVDGAVNGAALACQSGGRLLRTTQAGRVRGYVTLLFAFAGVVALLVVAVVLAAR